MTVNCAATAGVTLAEVRKETGLVQVFTGDGKGKTSAALGTVLRAAGHGLKVYIVFFMKGNYPYGEFSILKKLPGVDIATFGFTCLTDPSNIKPEEIEQARLGLGAAHEAIHSSRYDMIILDEINVALAWKLIEVDEVIRLVREKPANVELILTGRYADTRITGMADLVTDMVKLKHPYDKGVLARKGIEF